MCGPMTASLPAEEPPSTHSNWPLMKRARSDATNRTASAISSGAASRPSGTWEINAFWYSGFWLDSEMPDMSVSPGATTLHVMWCLPISSAITRASWISPALDAACGPDIGPGVVPRCGADQYDPAALALLDELPAYG